MTRRGAAIVRYVALLRAINVGGRTVKMDALRRVFEALSLANVQTFIASGNVIFDSPRAAADLEPAIEAALQRACGYPVETFLRSGAEIVGAAGHAPFPGADLTDAQLYVLFLRSAPPAAAAKQVAALTTELDRIAVRGREVYWLRHQAKARAGQPGPPIEKVITGACTTRNITTVRKIAAKYCQ
jgi:uncharacterized protein (DUF1697 family)